MRSVIVIAVLLGIISSTAFLIHRESLEFSQRKAAAIAANFFVLQTLMQKYTATVPGTGSGASPILYVPGSDPAALRALLAGTGIAASWLENPFQLSITIIQTPTASTPRKQTVCIYSSAPLLGSFGVSDARVASQSPSSLLNFGIHQGAGAVSSTYQPTIQSGVAASPAPWSLTLPAQLIDGAEPDVPAGAAVLLFEANS